MVDPDGAAMKRKFLTGFLYLVLLAVALSAVQTVWVGLADKERYRLVFPAAQGLLYWATLICSCMAGVNAVFIGLRKRWAAWFNPVIGVSSVVLLQIVGSPWINQVVVLLACGTSTVLPHYLWWTNGLKRQLT